MIFSIKYKFQRIFKISKTNPRFYNRYIIYSSVYQCLIFDRDRYHLTRVVLIGCEVENRSIRRNGLEFESKYELQIRIRQQIYGLVMILLTPLDR